MPRDIRGRRNPRWRGSDRMIDSQGYVRVRVGRRHPLADSKGYAREHEVVWAASGQPAPAPGQVIHHRNGDRSDNRLGNLELRSRSGHARLHAARQRRDEAGRFAGRAS